MSSWQTAAGTRASADIDLSMAGEFRQEELADIRARIKENLISTFRPAGFEVFDLTISRIDATIISNIIPIILTGRWVKREKPDGSNT